MKIQPYKIYNAIAGAVAIGGITTATVFGIKMIVLKDTFERSK